MQIFPLTDKVAAKEFLEVPLGLYANDPNWIRPLDKDISDVFDEKKNKAFRFGKVKRWILKDNEGNLVGRIAAFVNKKYKNKGDDMPVGGIGFFECINNQDAADLLFDNAKHWLLSENMEAMDGPINFGERDRWWGLVTKGFQEPLYCMNYNPPYYQDLFEHYGFKPFFHQVCLGMHPKKPLEKKIWDRHAAIANDPGFNAMHIKKNQLEKFAGDFATVYNKAWAGHGGLKQMSKEQVVLLFKKMKPVMDERIIWFAYYQDEPVAIFINLPDLNQWFKELDGKFGLLQKLRFLWLKQFRPNKKFNGLVFGVVPEWQGKGVDSYIIGESAKVIQSNQVPYSEYEMQWIGDFNPKMINIAEGLGEVFRTRNLTTYRFIFDRTKTFHRHPMLT
ncbi:MAG TPA: hypothetical protein PLC48_12405 [Ferruginibacter sp.]|nr:hypothetical protein [Ferruginibacter sp.]